MTNNIINWQACNQTLTLSQNISSYQGCSYPVSYYSTYLYPLKKKKSLNFFLISARYYYAFSSFHLPNSYLLEQLQNTHRRKHKFHKIFFSHSIIFIQYWTTIVKIYGLQYKTLNSCLRPTVTKVKNSCIKYIDPFSDCIDLQWH